VECSTEFCGLGWCVHMCVVYTYTHTHTNIHPHTHKHTHTHRRDASDVFSSADDDLTADDTHTHSSLHNTHTPSPPHSHSPLPTHAHTTHHPPPDHLIVSGGGGAFLHPTHLFAADLEPSAGRFARTRVCVRVYVFHNRILSSYAHTHTHTHTRPPHRLLLLQPMLPQRTNKCQYCTH
jgi:hypothetical protein